MLVQSTVVLALFGLGSHAPSTHSTDAEPDDSSTLLGPTGMEARSERDIALTIAVRCSRMTRSIGRCLS
jgi:hypothetical protein